MKLEFSRVKIVATLNPTSTTIETIEQFLKAGANIFRINSSHCNNEQISSTIKVIREASRKFKVSIPIIQDLQGPKIRVGEISGGKTELSSGNTIKITSKAILGGSKEICTDYKDFLSDVNVGEDVLLDDGKLQLRIIKKDDSHVVCKVIHGGILYSRKGINLPNTNLSLPILSSKDLSNLEIGLKEEVDWIALSFVRSADDVKELRKILQDRKKQCGIISKIEKPEALDSIEEIISVSDALMVARGDLGVETTIETIPFWQKKIVRKCNGLGKPVIIATQMMESMMTNPTPVRAEVNDIANSVIDGADALMLSGETAIGKYPFLTVSKMKKAILATEENHDIYNKWYTPNHAAPSFISNSLVQTTCQLAESLGAKAIICSTISGYTAYQIAKHRPKASIYVFSHRDHLVNAIELTWGVRSFYFDGHYNETSKYFEDLETCLKKKGLLSTGNICIHISAMPFNQDQRSNTIKVSQVKL